MYTFRLKTSFTMMILMIFSPLRFFFRSLQYSWSSGFSTFCKNKVWSGIDPFTFIVFSEIHTNSSCLYSLWWYRLHIWSLLQNSIYHPRLKPKRIYYPLKKPYLQNTAASTIMAYSKDLMTNSETIYVEKFISPSFLKFPVLPFYKNATICCVL